MNARPHPGPWTDIPIPNRNQERGKNSPSTCASNTLGDQTRLGANHLGLETAGGTCEFSSNFASPSLAPGERAGVRAGVNTFQHFVGASCLPL